MRKVALTGSTAALFAGDCVLTPDGQRGDVVGVSRDGRWASVEGRGARVVPELDGAIWWDLGDWPVEQLHLIERGQEGRWADQEAAEMCTADRRGRLEDKPDAA